MAVSRPLGRAIRTALGGRAEAHGGWWMVVMLEEVEVKVVMLVGRDDRHATTSSFPGWNAMDKVATEGRNRSNKQTSVVFTIGPSVARIVD